MPAQSRIVKVAKWRDYLRPITTTLNPTWSNGSACRATPDEIAPPNRQLPPCAIDGTHLESFGGACQPLWPCCWKLCYFAPSKSSRIPGWCMNQAPSFVDVRLACELTTSTLQGLVLRSDHASNEDMIDGFLSGEAEDAMSLILKLTMLQTVCRPTALTNR